MFSERFNRPLGQGQHRVLGWGHEWVWGSVYKWLININSIRGAVTCTQNKVCCGLDKLCARVLCGFRIFLSLLKFFFLLKRPAKLLGMYIVWVNLDVLQ